MMRRRKKRGLEEDGEWRKIKKNWRKRTMRNNRKLIFHEFCRRTFNL